MKPRLYNNSRHIPQVLPTLRIHSVSRKDTIAVRRTAALTTEPRLPLVQPTLGGPHFWMSRRAEGCRNRHITRLMLICGYHLRQGTLTRHIQCIPLRRAFYSINLLRASLTQQSTFLLEGPLLQLQPPLHSAKNLCE